MLAAAAISRAITDTTCTLETPRCQQQQIHVVSTERLRSDLTNNNHSRGTTLIGRHSTLPNTQGLTLVRQTHMHCVIPHSIQPRYFSNPKSHPPPCIMHHAAGLIHQCIKGVDSPFVHAHTRGCRCAVPYPRKLRAAASISATVLVVLCT